MVRYQCNSQPVLLLLILQSVLILISNLIWFTLFDKFVFPLLFYSSCLMGILFMIAQKVL